MWIGPQWPPAPPPRPKAISFGVGVVVISQGRFLLGRRRPSGVFALPGGKIEWGEPIFDAIVREVHEETGLIVHPRTLPFSNCEIFHVAEDISEGEHHLSLYAVADVLGGRLWNREPSKHEDWTEVTLTGAESLLRDEPHWVPLVALRRFREEIGLAW